MYGSRKGPDSIQWVEDSNPNTPDSTPKSIRFGCLLYSTGKQTLSVCCIQIFSTIVNILITATLPGERSTNHSGKG